MKIDSDQIEKRFNKIEETLDTIRDNHLWHIERYTRWTLIGIVFSTTMSMIAVATTVL